VGDDEETESTEGVSDDEAPGFGLGGALAALGGASYMLKHRASTPNSE